MTKNKTETNVYEGPTLIASTKKNSSEKPELIYGDDGKTPFTGYRRVPAIGWGGAKTSVMTWIQDGVVSPPSFTNPTDNTPFSMGGWNAYTKFWKPVVEFGKFGIDRYKDYRELNNRVAKWLIDQTIKLPTLTDRLTPSDQPGLSIHDVKQAEKEHLDIQSQYQIPSSIKASDEIRLNNVEK